MSRRDTLGSATPRSLNVNGRIVRLTIRPSNSWTALYLTTRRLDNQHLDTLATFEVKANERATNTDFSWLDGPVELGHWRTSNGAEVDLIIPYRRDRSRPTCP